MLNNNHWFSKICLQLLLEEAQGTQGSLGGLFMSLGTMWKKFVLMFWKKEMNSVKELRLHTYCLTFLPPNSSFSSA